MTQSYEVQLRQLARVLAEIAHTVESVTDADVRVERALTLLGQVVPYRRCALLEVTEDDARNLYVVPPCSDNERSVLLATMNDLFLLVSRAERIGRSTEAVPSLSLPIIGLDSLIGVIRVEPSDTVYDVTHLRVLSVVGAQLGAYLTTRRLHQRDRRREERLAAAHDFQQLLTGVVSHDLRNPLAVITMVASSLLARSTDEKQAESLRRALRNAEQAARLISDLADVTEARVSGALSVSPRPQPLAKIVGSVIDDQRTAHPRSTIELLDDSRAIEVTWDAERVTQMLVNLVGNAIAHGAHGLPVRVTVAADVDDHVAIDVHNFGPGIPPALLPAIFDPFTHGAEKPQARSARGLGLGLYIVDQIVRAHGGTISVTSNELSGTTFSIRMPRVCPHHDATSVGGRAATTPIVLVVDDDEDVRLALSGMLQKRGFRVAVAADGRAALDVMRGGLRPTLVLLDISMPRMTGEEVCEAMHADPALTGIPVVLISADTATAVRVSRERAKAFLSKPVSVEQLIATIESIH